MVYPLEEIEGGAGCSFKPLMKVELERRLEQCLYYYTHLRSHQGLGGATPAEIYFGQEPAHLTAILLEHDLEKGLSFVLLRSLISMRIRCFRF